jgi:hypothetical protein
MNIGKHRVHLSPFQNKKGVATATPVQTIVIAATNRTCSAQSSYAVASDRASAIVAFALPLLFLLSSPKGICFCLLLLPLSLLLPLLLLFSCHP